MRLKNIAACMLLVAGLPGVASAKMLFSDKMAYAVKEDHGNVVLIISNKSPESQVNLKAVSIVLPNTNGHPSKKVSVFNSASGQAITARTEIKLGSISDLTKLIPPSPSFAHYSRVLASEKPGCTNVGEGNLQCKSLGFGLQITMSNPKGMMVWDGMTDAYLEYVK